MLTGIVTASSPASPLPFLRTSRNSAVKRPFAASSRKSPCVRFARAFQEKPLMMPRARTFLPWGFERTRTRWKTALSSRTNSWLKRTPATSHSDV